MKELKYVNLQTMLLKRLHFIAVYLMSSRKNLVTEKMMKAPRMVFYGKGAWREVIPFD